MKFFEDHCNIETFRHAPHKWFGACLISPVHAAELRYKKKYHLQYGHAKKLFVFDMLLVLTTFAIAGAALFWYLYDPGITSDIYLDITTGSTRLKSGEVAEITTSYKNNSDQRLLNPKLRIKLPEGFDIKNTTSTSALYDETAKLYRLPALAPGDEGTIFIEAQAIALPEKEENLVAELSYTPEKTQKLEVKTVHFEFTARGSVLEGSISAPEQITDSATFPITIFLENKGQEAIENVILPLSFGEGLSFKLTSSSIGIVENLEWKIDRISAGEKAELKGSVKASAEKDTKEIRLQFTPSVVVNNKPISQNSFEQDIKIIHPSFAIDSNWTKDGVSPGDVAELKVRIINNGDTNLLNLSVSVPAVKGIVDGGKLVSLNGGVLKNGSLILNQMQFPEFTALPKNQSREIIIKIPLVANPNGGTDAQVSIPISGRGFSEFDTQNSLTRDAITPKLKIGTQLFASLETRYYTNDGDQLGIGPLPLTVGKETKFWIFVNLENTTSKVSDVAFSARLPGNISWTGKSSVSQGQDVSFNTGSRTISWKTQSLSAHANAGIYMEVAFTPGSGDVGRVPTVLENIRISGVDSFIGGSIERVLGPLKADFRLDKKALEMGILVQ